MVELNCTKYKNCGKNLWIINQINVNIETKRFSYDNLKNAYHMKIKNNYKKFVAYFYNSPLTTLKVLLNIIEKQKLENNNDKCFLIQFTYNNEVKYAICEPYDLSNFKKKWLLNLFDFSKYKNSWTNKSNLKIQKINADD